MKIISNFIRSLKFKFAKHDPSIFVSYIIYIFIGILLTESFYFGKAAGNKTFCLIYNQNVNSVGIFNEILVFVILIVLIYCYLRVQLKSITFYKKNFKFFLTYLFFLFIGICISYSLDGLFHEKYQKLISKINIHTLIIVELIPILIAVIYLLIETISLVKKKENTNLPIFFNDNPINGTNEDLLGTTENAKRFAEFVLNNNCSDNLIFGIDSPWGAGKSSFVKLCADYWSCLENQKPIMLIFEPVKYLDQTNLTEKLVQEIINAINEQYLDHKLGSKFEKYIETLKEDNPVELFGLHFNLPFKKSLNSELEKLQNALCELSRKIIIVIDDLDRLSWQECKKILFGIKQSLNLINVTYVLCYDSENLKRSSSNNNEVIDVLEFLEKYVNIKFSIYIDRVKLSKLVCSDSDHLLEKISTQSTDYYDQIKNILSGLKDIYESDDYYKYAYFVGDLRKVKRLINSILLLDVHSLDIKNSDIHGADLIKLLMVYINFPRTFRKIYDSEMNGGYGEFSVVYQSKNDAESKYQTSEKLIQYAKEHPSESDLLCSLFDVNTLEREKKEFVSINQFNTYNRACFNGANNTSRNLERYLNLIVNLKKQQKFESNKFYENKKNEFYNSTPINEIFKEVEFKENPEKLKLLNLIGATAHELDSEKAIQLSNYIIENINHFSLLNRKFFDIDSRSSLVYILLKMLDNGVWRVNGSYDNTNQENLRLITDYIFGERKFKNKGLIDRLISDDRLPIGFYDLLIFRLYCSADRANSFFNLQTALSLHVSKDAPTSGPSKEIARIGMRKISQVIFKCFENIYIKPKKNFFSEVMDLDFYILNGKNSDQNISENQNINEEQTKGDVLSFVIYQLSNKLIQSGVGCGYYDPTGENDENKIFHLMNKYLFDVCFNPKIELKNIEYFTYYLLNHLSTPFDTGKKLPEPNMETLTKVLDEEMLISFWKRYKKVIIEYKLHEIDKDVYNHNYVANYKRDLIKVYDMLNKQLKNKK